MGKGAGERLAGCEPGSLQRTWLHPEYVAEKRKAIRGFLDAFARRCSRTVAGFGFDSDKDGVVSFVVLLKAGGELETVRGNDAIIVVSGGDESRWIADAGFETLRVYFSEQNGDEFGAAVASQGDVNGDGMPEFLGALFASVPEGPALFPDDILTDYPRKLNIADVVREKFFHRLEQELPHAVAVWVEEIHEGEKKWRVKVNAYCI